MVLKANADHVIIDPPKRQDIPFGKEPDGTPVRLGDDWEA
jgi:hypothetical protein